MPAEKKKTALFIGRFQPFHRGHLSAAIDLLKEYDFVVVAVASSDQARTPENPFTVGERHAMVKAALTEEGFKAETNFVVVPVPDIEDADKYPKHVADLCPKFDVVVTGNPELAAIFSKKMKAKEVIVPKKKYAIDAARVRDAIGAGEDLEKYLHPAVVAFLQKIGAARKIIDINNGEEGVK